MTNTVESGQNTTLNQKVNSGDANATLLLSSVPWSITAGIILIGSGNSKEWASFTGVTSTTLTGVTMGLDKDATLITDSTTANKKNHRVGDPVRLVHHSLDINKKAGTDDDNTFTGDNTFQGDDVFEGSIRVPVYADATARDAAITSPSNGMLIYNTAEGANQQYIGGAWTNVETGSTPNGSETVAGKYELATTAEQGSATSAGGTGARLIPANSNLVKASSGAGDENKLAVLGSDGKFALGFIPDINPSESITTGENVTAGNALRLKIDGKVYKTVEDMEIGQMQEIFTETNTAASVGINTNKVVYVYSEAGDTFVKCKVFSWDGERYTVGTEATISQTDSATLIDVCKVDTDKFAAIFYDNNPANADTVVVVSTVSGTTVTAGSPVVVESGVQTATSRNSITSSDTDVITCTWQDDGDNDECRSKTATVSGTIPTFGAEVEVSTEVGSGQWSDVTEIGTGKVANVFVSADQDLWARVATISGNTMTQGTAVELHDAITISTDFTVAKVEDDKFIVTYRDAAALTEYLVVCTVSGTTITAGTPVAIRTFSGSSVKSPFVTYFSDNKVCLVYVPENIGLDLTRLQYMAAWVTTSGTVPTVHDIGMLSDEYERDGEEFDPEEYRTLAIVNSDMFQFAAPNSTTKETFSVNVADNNFLGFAASTETSGSAVIVNFAEDNNQTSLTAGGKYWLADSGAISSQGRVLAGTAVSTTKIVK